MTFARAGLLSLMMMAALAGAACRNGRAPGSVTTISSALTVGAEHPLSPPTQTHGENASTRNVQTACNAVGQCLAAWWQPDEGGPYLVARRFDASGPLDAGVIVLASGTGTSDQVMVGARATGDFMVSTLRPPNQMALVRVDAATGAVLDNPPILVNSVMALGAVFGVGDTYAAMFQSNVDANEYTVRVKNGLVLDNPPLFFGVASPTQGAVGPGQIASASTRGLSRLDVATGTVLDTTPIVFNKYAVGGAPGVASDGTNYLLIWYFDGQTYAARVRASDGALLDPPDEFNQLTGGHVIAAGSVLTGPPATFFDGTNFLAFWVATIPGDMSADNLIVTRVSPAGTRVSGSPSSQYEGIVARVSVAGNTALGYGTGLGMAAWPVTGQGIVGFTMTETGGAAPVSSNLSLSFEGSKHQFPAVATNGRDFLLAYQSTQDNMTYALVADGATGAVTPPVVLGPGGTGNDAEPTGAVWTGTNYLVAWQTAGSVYLRALSCTGQPLGAATTLAAGGNDVHLACNPDRCAVAYDNHPAQALYVQRINPDGSLVDTSPITIPGNVLGRFGIAADSQPVPAMRTFLIASGAGNVGVYRVRSALGAVASPTTVESTEQAGLDVVVASDGQEFFVSWQENGHILGTTVDAISGLATMAAPVDLGAGTAVGPVGWDGSSFVQLWYTATQLMGGRVSAAGAALDGGGFIVNGLARGQSAAIAAAPFGRSLAAFRVAAPAALADVFDGRFIDDELGAGVSARGPGCGATGTGGDAGGAGAGGVGGIGGATGGAGAGGRAGAGGVGGGSGTGGVGGSGGSTNTGGHGGITGAGGMSGASGTGGVGASAGAVGSGGATGGPGGSGGRGGSTSAGGTTGGSGVGGGGAAGAAGGGGGTGAAGVNASGGAAGAGIGGMAGAVGAGGSGQLGGAGATAGGGASGAAGGTAGGAGPSGSAGSGANAASGCSCAIDGREAPVGWAWLSIALSFCVFRRRHRRTSSPAGRLGL